MPVLGLPRRAAGRMYVIGMNLPGLARLPFRAPVRGASRTHRDIPTGSHVRWRYTLERSLLLAGPVLTVGFLVRACLRHGVAFDFMHASYMHGARDVWAGRSPYHRGDVAAGLAFLYPPLTAYAITPFLVLPRLVTEVVVSLLGAAACFGALWVAGVRDRRCYLAAFGSPVLFFSIQSGNISSLIILGAALVWRYRDRKLAALGAGVLVALKLYAWPLLLFFLVTRRIRAAVLAGASSVAAAFLPWAVLGFAGLTSYPGLLSARTHIEQGGAYTIGALAAKVVPWSVAYGITYALGALVIVWMTRNRSEAQVFAAALGLTVLLAPLALYDYFGVLFVVLAVMQRGFGWQWTALLLLWLAPSVGQASSWQLVLVLVVVGLSWLSATRSDQAATEARARPDAVVRRLVELRAALGIP